MAEPRRLAIGRNKFFDVVVNGLQHEIGILAGNEPAGDLHGRLCRNDGFCAGALVSTGHAVELERRSRPELLDDGAALFARGNVEPDRSQKRIGSDIQRLPLRELFGRRLLDAVIKARNGYPAGLVVQGGHDLGEHANGVRDRPAVDARVEVARRACNYELVAGEATQHRGDGGRILVPLAGVANEHEIGFELVAILGEEVRERRRAALFFALDQHRNGDRQIARNLFPGPCRLEEGHQLTLVVFGAPSDDHVAVARLIRDARLERRRLPEIKRIRRLYVIMAVEQDVRHIRITIEPIMGHDHRMAACRHNLGLGEPDVSKRRRAPFRGFDATGLIRRVGRYAIDAQKFEQSIEARRFRLAEGIENGFKRAHRARLSDLFASGGGSGFLS